jgi:two-component system chemotaxis response regulator CheB
VSVHPIRAARPSEEPVIALVASAGGLDAVSRIVGGLPEAFDASVVVLIHQEPNRVSHVVELLSRRSSLPVVAAAHGSRLRPGKVIVIPPGKHLIVAPGLTTALIVSGAAPPSRPSADLLLATLATAAGRRAIAVILSGGGHDGAAGATAIHAFGGTVIASEEASSQSFSMPRATITRGDAVDHVVALGDVVDLLRALVGAAKY